MVTRAGDCQNRQRICDPALAYRVCKAHVSGALIHVHLQAALALSMQHKSAPKHVRTGNTLMQAGWHYPIAQAHRAAKQRRLHTRVAPHKRPAVGYRELHPCASLAMQTVVPGRIAIQGATDTHTQNYTSTDSMGTGWSARPTPHRGGAVEEQEQEGSVAPCTQALVSTRQQSDRRKSQQNKRGAAERRICTGARAAGWQSTHHKMVLGKLPRCLAHFDLIAIGGRIISSSVQAEFRFQL